LTGFIVPGVPLTDADCTLIGEQEQLTHLNLMQSEITDAGLAALNPKRLRAFNVAGTRVTSAALQRELAGSQLQYLLIDGKQFTPELAAQLAQMKSLNMLSLIGPDVTDAHIKLLESVPNATYIGIDQTSATEAAVEALRATKPNPASVEVTTPGTIFAKCEGMTNPTKRHARTPVLGVPPARSRPSRCSGRATPQGRRWLPAKRMRP
jgi:hypothetical protein